MPLIQRIDLDNHTIREFQIAAKSRYYEATRLAEMDDRLAAIYLAGYSAEMLLKAAYFRLTGFRSTELISFKDIQNARTYAQSNLKLNWSGNLHDLNAWVALLIEERKCRICPYLPAFVRKLQANIQRIHVNWREQIRYRSNRPYPRETKGVLRGVKWLLGQERHL